MPSKGTVVMIGPPASGKTTFLAALWHQLESSEIQTAFTAERLQPDREFLNRIRTKWLEFEQIPRTPIGIERASLIHLRHIRSGAEYDLSIPDIIGEVFSAQWNERRIPPSYINQIETSFGLLLFIHCRQVAKAEILSATFPASSNSVTKSFDWDPRMAPTQVKLVDSLQTALGVLEGKRTMRVAVIISAWDEITERITPKLWLERNLPLIDQFIRANTQVMETRVFGVSAIGGNLDEKEELALIASPSSRVRVYVEDEMQHDITLPLEFVIVDTP